MVWRLGSPHIVLKVRVRQNANTNYIDDSINEVTLSPLTQRVSAVCHPLVNGQSHLTDLSDTMNESDTHILKN